MLSICNCSGTSLAYWVASSTTIISFTEKVSLEHTENTHSIAYWNGWRLLCTWSSVRALRYCSKSISESLGLSGRYSGILPLYNWQRRIPVCLMYSVTGERLTVGLDCVWRDLSWDRLLDIRSRDRITQAEVSSILSLTADTMACKQKNFSLQCRTPPTDDPLKKCSVLYFFCRFLQRIICQWTYESTLSWKCWWNLS